MKKRNKLIITLFTFGVILFTIVQFIIVPKQKADKERYLSNQLEATTQDLNYIIVKRDNDLLGIYKRK